MKTRIRTVVAVLCVASWTASGFLASPAAAAEENLIKDPALRQCLADLMHEHDLGFPVGSPLYATDADSISQADLDALADDNLSGFRLKCPGLSYLEGLQYLDESALTALEAPRGTISDLRPLTGFTGLRHLDLSHNQISDLEPLTQMPLETLLLHNNLVTDITPVQDMLNKADITAKVSGHILWSLADNRITDLSVIDWGNLSQEWPTQCDPSYRFSGPDRVWPLFAATNQTLVRMAVLGDTTPLPHISTAANSPHPIAWTVESGDATINHDNGTITYNSLGLVELSWSDQPSEPCLIDGQEVPVSFFSGRVQVRVAQYPGTSAAHSTVTIRESFSPVTGGVAPWADGTDSYTLVVTLTDENGIPQPGYAEDIVSWSTPQSGIVIHDVAEQDDQTYIITVTATEPGNYSLEIRLNYGTYAEPLSQPVELNFLGATIHQPTRTAGSIQSAEGHGFLPGETVTAVAVNYVDRVELGTLTADQNGDVRISFTVPTGFTEGLTTVRFTGETSGTAQIGYRVTDSSLMTFILLGAGALLCLAVVFGLALALRGHRHRAHELR